MKHNLWLNNRSCVSPAIAWLAQGLHPQALGCACSLQGRVIRRRPGGAPQTGATTGRNFLLLCWAPHGSKIAWPEAHPHIRPVGRSRSARRASSGPWVNRCIRRLAFQQRSTRHCEQREATTPNPQPPTFNLQPSIPNMPGRVKCGVWMLKCEVSD